MKEKMKKVKMKNEDEKVENPPSFLKKQITRVKNSRLVRRTTKKLREINSQVRTHKLLKETTKLEFQF